MSDPQRPPAEALADPGTRADLRRLRRSLDNLDAALIHLLAERFKITEQVGILKAEHSLPATDSSREAEHAAKLRDLARSAELDPSFAETFFGLIVSEVVHHHRAIARPGD